MSSIIDRLIDQEPGLTLSEQLDVVVFIADELLDACEYALRETVRPSSDPLIKALKEAIRKASR